MRTGREARHSVAAGVGVIAVALSSCTASSGHSTASASPHFTVLTPTATSSLGAATWALYREVQSLDPIKAFDYPENTADALVCDALLRQQPDGSITPGLATLRSASPTDLVLTVRPGARFWDGHPVTSADVLFGLQRAADPNAGGFYSSVFARVLSMTALDSRRVQIKLTSPDYWLPGELSSPAGMIPERSFVLAEGHRFGGPGVGTMCSGPFEIRSWHPGNGLVLVPNPHYWDASVGLPRVRTLTLVGVPDPATLTSGIESGAVTGAYPYPLARLSDVATSAHASVYLGPPAATVALAVSATTGPLATVAVRQALSLAIDRPRLIADVFGGAAQVPHALMGSGTWGYERDTFSAAYAALPAMTMDIARARAMITSSHANGQTIRLATATQDPTLAAEASAVASAATAIGLKVRLVAVSPADYVQFFTDPKAWQSVDGFISTNYGDYADPAAFYKTIALAGGSQNFDDWSDPTVTALLDRAQAAASPVVRARDTSDAQALITREQVWIPLVLPDTVLLLHRGATGPPATFSYMFAPWAVRLGGTSQP